MEIDRLLVTCCNKGGLIHVGENKQITVIDQVSSTGLERLPSGDLVRGLQDKNSPMVYYGRYWKGEDWEFVLEPRKFDVQDTHDLFYWRGRLYVASTGTNEIVSFDESPNEVMRFRFPGQGDSWHINGIGLWADRLVASAFGIWQKPRGYDEGTQFKGIVLDVFTGAVLECGLNQPHSPFQLDRSWTHARCVCNSRDKEVWVWSELPGLIMKIPIIGYPRGVAFGKFLYIGTSILRHEQEETGKKTSEINVYEPETLSFRTTIHIPYPEIYDILACPGINPKKASQLALKAPPKFEPLK